MTTPEEAALRRDSDALFYAAAGPIVAMGLAVALMPLRELTPASNFTFAFLVVTIAAAELGGGAAGLSTALVSALSLDFLLTRPYLRLEIESKHDVIAFLGLGVCGLAAAGLAGYRRRRLSVLESTRAHRELLSRLLERWDPERPAAAQMAEELQACVGRLPITAAVARDEQGRVIASSPSDAVSWTVPSEELEPDLLAPRGTALPWRGSLALPEQGGRIPLRLGRRRVGSLDLWGSGEPASLEARRTVSDVARLLALQLATCERAGLAAS